MAERVQQMDKQGRGPLEVRAPGYRGTARRRRLMRPAQVGDEEWLQRLARIDYDIGRVGVVGVGEDLRIDTALLGLLLLYILQVELFAGEDVDARLLAAINQQEHGGGLSLAVAEVVVGEQVVVDRLLIQFARNGQH